MQAPELLLSDLNRALRELRGAARILKDERLDTELLPVIRSLLLAEVVSQEWTVAVGGSQGAGKTNLVRAMYGLSKTDSPWLVDNEGQGERLPVLIQEDAGHERAQGYVRLLRPCATDTERFELVEQAVSVEEFAQACRGVRAEVLLPVLKVPRKFFQYDGQALILLPGYEKTNRDNKIWQALMRQVLVGAAGCIIVTDHTRMPTKEQQVIAQDMLSDELRHTRPLIVVSKTEGLAGEPAKLEEVRDKAAEVFHVPAEHAARQIICTGSDDPEYVAQWMPKLHEALHSLSISSPEARQMQLTRLETTLDRDLNRAVNLIHTRATLFFQQADGGGAGTRAVVKSLLETYDDAVAALREDYRKVIDRTLGSHFNQAWDELRDMLGTNHEGFINKLTGFFNTYTEAQQRLEADVTKAWGVSGSVLDKYTVALGTLTSKVRDSADPAEPGKNVLQRLGYVDGQGAAIESKLTNTDVQTDLAVLLGAGQDKLEERPRSTTELEKTVRLLPTMALEYTRLASALPEIVGINATTLEPLKQADVLGSAKHAQQQFEQFSEVSKSLLKGLAVMLAVDFSVVGHVDTIPALLAALGMGGTAPIVGGTAVAGAGTAAMVATSVAGVVAVGFIVHTALQEMRRYDGEVHAFAHTMLLSTREHHFVHFMSHFDDLMSKLRNHMMQGMRRRFALDQQLMEQDRLAKALADVHVLQRDMLDELSRSGQTLQLFGGAATA